MSIFPLHPDFLRFPPPQYANPDGLLALGGVLSEEWLLEAYCSGIFPWYNEGEPILWWSPDPRFVLYPEEIKISKSLRKVIRKEVYEVRIDSAFEAVIRSCAEVRVKSGIGTWITSEMRDAFINLHEQGYAHSFESWYEGELVGGLYGVALGKTFSGESMFCTRSNASKVALVALTEHCKVHGIALIDCQLQTPHLASMGAKSIRRSDFLNCLHEGLMTKKTHQKWNTLPELCLSHKKV